MFNRTNKFFTHITNKLYTFHIFKRNKDTIVNLHYILPAFSKIHEIVCQLSAYVQTKNILPVVQSGFFGGFSCASYLTHIVNIISASIQGRVTVLKLLDFSRRLTLLITDYSSRFFVTLIMGRIQLRWLEYICVTVHNVFVWRV